MDGAKLRNSESAGRGLQDVQPPIATMRIGSFIYLPFGLLPTPFPCPLFDARILRAFRSSIALSSIKALILRAAVASLRHSFCYVHKITPASVDVSVVRDRDLERSAGLWQRTKLDDLQSKSTGRGNGSF